MKDKKISTFAEAESRLAESLPGYESRSQQQLLARTIETSIAEEKHLLAEAGTGTGKSLGYLIPAILSGKRVIVSTATKALQDQIFGKDVPFLAEHLGVEFSYALLKGRSNYLCLNKALTVEAKDCPSLSQIMQAAKRPGFDGTKDGLGFEVNVSDWMQVAADSDECSALDCKKVNPELCFAEQAREVARKAQVVVVNHALFLTDLVLAEATGGNASMLGAYDVVVFDEAHEIEEYAGNALGSQFKQAGLINVVSECRNYARRYAAAAQEPIESISTSVLSSITQVWSILEEGRIRQANLLAHADEYVALANGLAELHQIVAEPSFLDDEFDTTAKKRQQRIEGKVGSVAVRFARLITDKFDQVVRWVEIEKTRRGEDIKVIRSAPINVGTLLRPMLFETDVTAILASATLSVNGKFDYVAGRLGIDKFNSIDVGTPFDYPNQALLYVPKNLPAPTEGSWASLSLHTMEELVRASDGRALLLFTSTRQMKMAYDTLAKRLPYKCFKQGDAPNGVLIEQFKADTHSVLFAVKSFFTGVDVQGEALSLVIMDKLPFPVPTEPLTEARCEAIKKRGGSDFSEYTVPVMSLVLKQGFGRLIRHRNDRGVVAILDSRLLTKGYGKQIMSSLPDAHQATVQDEVKEFFAA